MNYVLIAVVALVFSCTQHMTAHSVQSQAKSASASVTMTASFQSLADLPHCDAGSEHLGAYIRDRQAFVQCLNSSWRDVRPGDTSGHFLAREPIRYYEWTDRSTGMRWSLPKQDEINMAALNRNICSKGWKLPTHDELTQASFNGLFEGLKSHGGIAFDKAWTANLDALAGISKGTLMALMPGSDVETKAGVYCVAAN